MYPFVYVADSKITVFRSHGILWLLINSLTSSVISSTAGVKRCLQLQRSPFTSLYYPSSWFWLRCPPVPRLMLVEHMCLVISSIPLDGSRTVWLLLLGWSTQTGSLPVWTLRPTLRRRYHSLRKTSPSPLWPRLALALSPLGSTVSPCSSVWMIWTSSWTQPLVCPSWSFTTKRLTMCPVPSCWRHCCSSPEWDVWLRATLGSLASAGLLLVTVVCLDTSGFLRSTTLSMCPWTPTTPAASSLVFSDCSILAPLPLSTVWWPPVSPFCTFRTPAPSCASGIAVVTTLSTVPSGLESGVPSPTLSPSYGPSSVLLCTPSHQLCRWIQAVSLSYLLQTWLDFSADFPHRHELCLGRIWCCDFHCSLRLVRSRQTRIQGQCQRRWRPWRVRGLWVKVDIDYPALLFFTPSILHIYIMFCCDLEACS